MLKVQLPSPAAMDQATRQQEESLCSLGVFSFSRGGKVLEKVPPAQISKQFHP